MNLETISVVGLGYIGLPTAAVLASSGRKVIGVDIDPETVAIVNRGEIHIIEPKLDELVCRVVGDGYLRATTAPEPADAFLIAVPTPFKDGHEPDLKFIETACRSIAPVLKPGNIVILESTSPVGATEQMAAWLAEERPDLRFPGNGIERPDVAVAHCPERVLPGNVLHELVHNDRVIGGLTAACSRAAVEVYRIFVAGECIVTTARTAEMCKLTENSFRDVNIAFANELSIICNKLNINVWELISLANRHPRVNILQPGPGVGGHCIAVDPWFIVHSCPDEANVIRTAREVNDYKPDWVLTKVDEAIRAIKLERAPGTEITVACLGLSFKPNIDDLRQSPALDICCRVADRDDCRIIAVEPHVAVLPPVLEGRVQLGEADEAVASADVVLLLVDHSQFHELPDPVVAGKRVIDTRGLWSGRISQHVNERGDETTRRRWA